MDLKEKIRNFVIIELADNGIPDGLDDNESLIDSGILDSLNILNLISFFDENFNIIPSEDELYPDNFDTINLIHKYIEEKLG